MKINKQSFYHGMRICNSKEWYYDDYILYYFLLIGNEIPTCKNKRITIDNINKAYLEFFKNES